MAQWVDVSATKPKDLSSTPQDPHDGGRDVNSCKLSLYVCTLAHTCPHTHSHTYKQL